MLRRNKESTEIRNNALCFVCVSTHICMHIHLCICTCELEIRNCNC